MQLSEQNLVDLITDSLSQNLEAPAFTCLGRTLSFRELDQLSDAIACWLLHEFQLQPGDRVAIQLPNVLQFPVMALGVFKARGVIVNVNPLYTSAEIRHQLIDSGARLLIALENIANNAAAILEDTEIERVILTEFGDLHHWPRRLMINYTLRYLKQAIPPFSIEHQISLTQVLHDGKACLAQGKTLAARPGNGDLAVLQYTGGTTGVAKGAMLSHRNLVNNVLQLNAVLGEDCPGEGALMVAPLPLYHVYAFSMSFLVSLQRRHHTILVPNPRDTGQFVNLLRRIKVNGFIGISTLYKQLVEHPDFARIDFSRLQVSSSGGMAMAPYIADLWQQKTGRMILEGYGLTECSPVVSCNNYRQYRGGTAGKVVPCTEICLKAQDGTLVATGQAGEVCLKGPQVMLGYWQRPEENAKVFDADGWLHTGDVGILDEAGYLTIVDRIKDLIIISGFNVFPNEIEDHVCTHPGITDACAIAVGEEYEARIKLYVVVSDTTLTSQQIIDYCRTTLAPYKVPKQVEFRISLPKSSVGKVLRRQLREDNMRIEAILAEASEQQPERDPSA